MKKIIDRWKSESPELFKKITNICVGIGALSAAIISGGALVPPILTTIANYGVVIGAIGATISKLTKKDNTDEDTSNKKD
jgi:hypothetical protein